MPIRDPIRDWQDANPQNSNWVEPKPHWNPTKKVILQPKSSSVSRWGHYPNTVFQPTRVGPSQGREIRDCKWGQHPKHCLSNIQTWNCRPKTGLTTNSSEAVQLQKSDVLAKVRENMYFVDYSLHVNIPIFTKSFHISACDDFST